MKRIAAVAFAALAAVPLSAFARNEALTCAGVHFVRAGGTEMRSTVVGFRNADLENAATIQRLTIRNFFGQVVHDSGPATGTPLPLNGAFPGGFDVTVVPPGASYFLATSDIWGLNPIPGTGGNNQGFNLAITVEFSKAGKGELLMVGTRPRSRERFVSPEGVASEGRELATNTGNCVGVRPTI